MPHLVLEYSANLIEKDKFSELFSELHQLLAEQLPTQLSSCKSRAYEAQNYFVGDGNPNNAFVYLSIHVLPGRSVELLQTVANQVFVLLQNHFAASCEQLKLQISLRFGELDKVYLKW